MSCQALELSRIATALEDYGLSVAPSTIFSSFAFPEIQLGRGLSPAEALKNPNVQLDIAHRIVLEQWLAEFFERFDAIAGHLIPIAKAKALQAARMREVVAPKRRISGVNLQNIQ